MYTQEHRYDVAQVGMHVTSLLFLDGDHSVSTEFAQAIASCLKSLADRAQGSRGTDSWLRLAATKFWKASACVENDEARRCKQLRFITLVEHIARCWSASSTRQVATLHARDLVLSDIRRRDARGAARQAENVAA